MPTDSARKQLARQLARSLDDPTTLPLLQFLSSEADGVSAGPRGGVSMMGEDWATLLGPSAHGVPKISIWEQAPGGDFIRSKDHAHVWRFCADVERIPAKSAGKRIAYIGESVARGYFFDPLYCPAKVLEVVLRAAGMNADVVDLAVSNSPIQYHPTVAALAAEHLKPDAIVVFAGNNWAWAGGGNPLAVRSADTYVNAALVTSEHGWSKLREIQAQRVREVTERTVTDIAETAARIGVPLIFVVPEINLKDNVMRTEGGLDLPLLSPEDTKAWVASYSRASEFFTKGDFAAAERAIADALAIDGGTSSASLDILGFSQLEQGKSAEAATNLRRSKEAVSLLLGTHPGIIPVVRDTILSTAKRAGATVIDLQQLLAERYPGVPDRRAFLDYCHLTSDAIKTVMAATAESLLRALGGRPIPAAELFGHAPGPSDEAEGWAHFLAGVQNNSTRQSVEICAYHFSRALELHPPIAEAMEALYAGYSSNVPIGLNTAFAPLTRGSGAMYWLGYILHFRLRHFGNGYAMLMSLRRALPRLESEPLDREFTLGPTEETDLLGGQFLGKSFRGDYNERWSRLFHAAYAWVQDFSFACDSPRDLSLFLTACVPGALEGGELVVELNGKVINRLSVNREWTKATCRAAAEVVKPGLNQLTLRWPHVSREDRRPTLRAAVETGRRYDPLTHFGWVGQLTVSCAR